MIKQLHLWQAILFISILGVCGCYVNEETAPSYFTPEGAYSASLSTILEFDSTSAFLQATAYVAPLNHSNDSEWDVNLNSTRLGYVPSSNSYSSNVIPPVANATLNWSLSKGSRSNLAELDILKQKPINPNHNFLTKRHNSCSDRFPDRSKMDSRQLLGTSPLGSDRFIRTCRISVAIA